MRSKLVRCLATAVMVATVTANIGTIESYASSTPKLNKTKVTITAGKTTTLKVKNLSKKVKVTWKSTKKSVATVSSKGKVKAKKKGTAFIKATFKYKKSGKLVKKTLKCKVTVKAKKVQATKTPTPKPTATTVPTVAPTATPTVAPTATTVPTEEPTSTPTATVEPTEAPVVETTTPEVPESVQATATPTAVPTVEPTTVPTEVPVETPAHVHDYNDHYEVVKDRTCTEDGLINLYCECGEVYQRVICADHMNISWVAGFWERTQPTETTDGYFELHCNDCGEDVTFSKTTTFPALTDENYPLEGWVYEKHDYDYDSGYYKITGKVDRTHEKPYIIVTDYIGSAEHPALKNKYVIDGVEYEVEIHGQLRISSPTAQSLKIYGATIVNPDFSKILEKKINCKALAGRTVID